MISNDTLAFVPSGRIPPQNIHATAIVAGDRGLLIVGPSGSGKTSLALALVDHFDRHGKFARLVGDDQLFVEAHGQRLVCRAPATISGLAEIPGLGPQAVQHELAAVIDLVIRLVPAARMPRFQDAGGETVAGCVLPALLVAERNVVAGVPTIVASLKSPAFRPG